MRETPPPMIVPGEPEAMSFTKGRLRNEIKAKIAALAPADRLAEEQALVARFERLPGLAEATRLLLFVSALPEEPTTVPLFEQAYAMKKIVLCPRVDRRRRRLILHRVTDPATDLRPGILGIPEPSPELPEVPPTVVDWALVPGLAFDHQGFRLGRGGGFYDRLMPELRPDAICWALCLGCQLVDRLPIEPHDTPLDGVSTAGREVRGRRGSQSLRISTTGGLL